MSEKNPSISFQPKPTHGTFLDLEGEHFGRLIVLGFIGRRHQRYAWLCQCECGKTSVVTTTHLRSGHTQSCGCLFDEAVFTRALKHGMAGTRVHRIWVGMRTRCTNPRATGYNSYGGRGIKVCPRWMRFENFLADMGEPPTDKHSIERIDNDGDYEPGNCIWADEVRQGNNKSNNRVLTLDGRSQTLAQWANELHIKRDTLCSRLDRYGWSEERALSTPVKKLNLSYLAARRSRQPLAKP